MTAVFVHGVPETAGVWDALVERLRPADAVALQLPGFGCDPPDGFAADMESYAAWLADELSGRDAVDLVTHDWGALLAARVLADRPANVRSWVSDMGDLGADFRWHDTARTWQTPGEGEAMIEGLLAASIDDRAAVLAAVGVPGWYAPTMAEGFDARMGAAILALYRSATGIGHEWGPGIDRITTPGLLVESVHDPFRSADRVRRLARRTGSQIVTLEDSGHFWMLDAPDRAAAAIGDFWGSLGR